MNAEADKKLNTIRNLLAKAEDAGVTPEEAMALNEKATELVAKYGIDMALLEMARPEREREGVVIEKVTLMEPHANDKMTLFNNISWPCRVRVIKLNDTTIEIFGFATDIARVKLLYESLVIQMTSGMIVARSKAGTNGITEAKLFATSFNVGFIQAVHARVYAAEQRARNEARKTAGNEIALVSREDEVARRVSEMYPDLHTTKAKTVRANPAAVAAGMLAGDQADLGGTRLNKTQQNRVELGG